MHLLGCPNSSSGGLITALDVSFSNARSPSASADRRETSPHDRKLGQFYNASPKIRGLPQKWELKHAKFRSILIQPHTLIADISGTSQDIQNRKANCSRAIPAAFDEESPVNFGPLITEL